MPHQSGRTDRKGACEQHVHKSSGRQSFKIDAEDKSSVVAKSAAGDFHLQKRYWGRHFWAGDKFFATSHRVTDEQIKDYIDGYDEKPADPEFAID